MVEITNPLFPVIVVHCFFWCGYSETSVGPEPAHERMEQHYREHHGEDIARARRFLGFEEA